MALPAYENTHLSQDEHILLMFEKTKKKIKTCQILKKGKKFIQKN